MGTLQNVVGRLRRAFVADKERGGDLLAKGATAPTYPDSGYDLLQAYGYDALSDYLRLEHDLLSRFVDYEEMDDEPTVACFSGETALVLPNGSGTFAGMSISGVTYSTLGKLAEDYAAGKHRTLLVYALDHQRGRVVVAEARGPVRTGSKRVYKITYEEYKGSDRQQWAIKATEDHLFMLRDGSYRALMALKPGDRLMPCTIKVGVHGYPVVYEPLVKKETSARWTAIHRLVAEACRGRQLQVNEIVHHQDHNRANYSPSNLVIRSRNDHVRIHMADALAETSRRSAISRTVEQNWADLDYKLRMAKAQDRGGGTWLVKERSTEKVTQGVLSERHRAAIARGHTLPLARDVVEAALRASSSLSEAASKLEVSWNTLVRRMTLYGLDREVLGSNLHGPHVGETEYLNHRVVSIEPCGVEDVYDLEVPKYHNFAVGTGTGGFIFAHNSAIDIYADDASQFDHQLQRSVWVTSPDKTLQGVLDDLFYKQLRMDEEIWEITRSLVKYGNNVEELLVTEDGVVGLNFLPAPTVRRVEGPRGELYGFVQDHKGRFGYCIKKGARVWGNRSGQGVVEIQNFDHGVVLGWRDDRPALLPVKRLHSNGQRRVVCLRTRHREIFLTEDHPVLARQGKKGDFAWTKVRDLRIEYNGRTDKTPDLAYHRTAHVMIATRMPGGEVPTWDAVWGERPYRPSDNPNATVFSPPERPTKDFIRLFGYMLGNGWVYEHADSKQVGYARTEYPEINNRYDGVLKELGVTFTVRDIATHVYSINFANFFEACGWINGFANKRIPPWMFALPEEYREELLWGFIDADGSTRAPAKFTDREKFVAEGDHVDRYAFSVSNLELARDFKNLIDGLGYVAGNLCEWMSKAHESKGKWIETDKPSYHVGFANAKFVEPFVAEPVLSIEDAGEAEVYDVEVSDDVHNFVSDGVVVHNSPQEFQKILAQRTDSIRNMMQPGAARSPGNYLQQVAALEPWEVVHMRLRGKHRRSIYGWSVLEPARWIWKRLMLLEDSALIYRLQRAPERFAFYVDVGDLPPGEALAFVNKIRQTHKKRRFTNPSSGKLDLRFDAISSDDDFWVPVRKGVEGTRIEVLGAPAWQAMEDVSYFQDKLFSALKVPKAYLAQDENINRATLSAEDVRFCRSVMRVQREVKNGLSKIARVHLAAINVDPAKVEYSVNMTVPSSIFELAQLEVRNARADLATRMREHVSLRWVLQNVYQLSDDDVKVIIKERSEDLVREGKAQAEVEKMSAQAQAGAGGGEFGGGAGAEEPPESAGAGEEAGAAGESRKVLTGLRLIERKLRKALPRHGYGISEEELLKGSKEAEKRAEGKLHKIMQSQDRQVRKLREVGELVREVVAAGKR